MITKQCLQLSFQPGPDTQGLFAPPPEGEQEEQWLADAGLSNLISEDSQDVDEAVLLSTLTRTQAEAVQRRVESYTLSLRKRNKPAPRDVRDVFNPPINQVGTQHISR